MCFLQDISEPITFPSVHGLQNSASFLYFPRRGEDTFAFQREGSKVGQFVAGDRGWMPSKALEA
jgi:hypothetical protein